MVELLGRHGIEVIAYKGPALAASLYGSPEKRSFRDLDLLVPEAELFRVQELLVERGYQATPSLTPEQTAQLIREGYHLQFLRAEDRVLLEVHWRVSSRYFAELDMAELRQRRREGFVLGRRIYSLAPEDQLVCLAVHAARHHWDCLGYAVDLTALLHVNGTADWEYGCRLAQRSGTLRRVQLALLLCAELLDSTVAQGVLARLPQDPAAEVLAAHYARRLRALPITPHGLLQHVRLDLLGMERFRDQLRYCRGVLSPNTPDWSELPLPPGLVWLTPWIRPVRLLRQHGLFDRRSPDR